VTALCLAAGLKSTLGHVQGLAGLRSVRGDWLGPRHRGGELHREAPHQAVFCVPAQVPGDGWGFPDWAENRGEEKGEKSVLFPLIKGAVEKGSVVCFVALGRPILSSPYQFGNIVKRRCCKTKGTGRHCHLHAFVKLQPVLREVNIVLFLPSCRRAAPLGPGRVCVLWVGRAG